MTENKSSGTTRRQFCVSTASASLAAALSVSGSVGAFGANERVRVGLIGCGGRGRDVFGTFLGEKDVDAAYVCDVDKDRLASSAEGFAGRRARPVDDIRRVLDDKSVDAVLVATPDHWHAPAAILACDAGKHVYVEKPCSHNVREGRLLVEAARRNRRVVQHGTQVRSTPMMIEAMEKLRGDLIGDVLVAKAWNIQRRRSIGQQKPTDPPPSLDYDSWVGPATFIPFQQNRVHGDWHWWWHFGTGDMGNDGVHDIDYCRWGLGVETHPDSVSALGGKYFFDDDQEFPDTQQVSFEYRLPDGGRKMLIYEQRLWSTNHPHGVDSGVEFYGTKGQLFVSRRGRAELLDGDNRSVELKLTLGPQDTDRHVRNFVAAVRGEETANAEIAIGHQTTTLCHLGNLATRLGRTLRFDPKKETIQGDEEANALLGRSYRDHWGRPKGA